jgi:hypothetical protein
LAIFRELVSILAWEASASTYLLCAAYIEVKAAHTKKNTY